MDHNISNIYVDADTYTAQHEYVDSPSNIPLPTIGSSSMGTTSYVSEHFEKISINNPNGTITFKEKYKYCAHLLSVSSADSTSHLKRHANKYLQS